MKKAIRFVKFIPLILLGIAVIVWGFVFQKVQEVKKKNLPTPPGGKSEPPIFPY